MKKWDILYRVARCEAGGIGAKHIQSAGNCQDAKMPKKGQKMLYMYFK